MTKISRRTLLRSAPGFASFGVALPPLETMFASDSVFAEAGKKHKRFFAFYAVGSVHGDSWFPEMPEDINITSLALPSLRGSSLEPFYTFGLQNNVSVYRGMNNAAFFDGFGSAELRGIAGFLTGSAIDSHIQKTHVISLDQALADWNKDVLGFNARVHSLPVIGNPEYPSAIPRPRNADLAHGVSYDKDGKRLRTKISLENIFDQLFSNSFGPTKKNRSLRRRIIDAVKYDREKLLKRLGYDDRQRVNEFLESLDNLEHEIERLKTYDDGATCGTPVFPQPLYNETNHYKRLNAIGENARILAKMIAIAFQCDLTSAATYITSCEAYCNGRYHDVFGSPGYYYHNHIQHNPDKYLAEQRKVDFFHAELAANFLLEFKNRPYAGGNLLDCTGFLFGSGMGSDKHHTLENIPLLVAGNIGGWQHGRYHLFDGENHARLLNSLRIALGIGGDTFGDAEGRTIPLS